MKYKQPIRLLNRHAEYAPPAGVIDNEDISVWKNDKKIPINVKTASQPFHKNIICYQNQLDFKGTNEVYVGVRLEGKHGRIYGFFYAQDLHPIKLGPYDTLGIAIEELRPLDDMITKIDKGQTIIKLPYGLEFF